MSSSNTIISKIITPTMIVREDILVKLTAEPITKIIGETGQGNISNLEPKLMERAAKKTTDDMVHKGCKHGF